MTQSIDWDRAVLLPIDMQQAFDGPDWPRRWNRDVDGNGLALLAAWRASARPVIHVRHDSVSRARRSRRALRETRSVQASDRCQGKRS